MTGRLPIVLLMCAALAGAQRPSPGQAAYEKANALFSAQQFQECMDSIDEALRLDPKLVAALTLKAKLAMAARRYDVARESLERALAADPASAYAQFLYGFQFYEQNQIPAAIGALEKSRKLNPRDPRAALYLGLARESQGEAQTAIALYYEASRLEQATGKPQVSTLLTAFRLHLVLGELDKAQPLIDRALKLAPASRDVYFQAARLRMKKGEAAASARECEAALKMAPGDTTDRQIHFLLVQAYRTLGQDSDAARHADEIRKTDEK